FLVLMKNSIVIIGNSSAGIREAPSYAVPTVNIGTRQHRRFSCASIVNVEENREAILQALASLPRGVGPVHHFGQGDCAAAFLQALRNPEIWKSRTQKQFKDVCEPAQKYKK